MESPEQDHSAKQSDAANALQSFELQSWIEAGKPGSAVVAIAGEDELAEHYADLVSASQISISFSGFMDGRGFSHARKLRQLGFTGKLVAAGDVLPDQWVYLQRCGFDVIASSEVASSATALPGFTERYQADARESQPLFRRKTST